MQPELPVAKGLEDEWPAEWQLCTGHALGGAQVVQPLLALDLVENVGVFREILDHPPCRARNEERRDTLDDEAILA